MSTFLTPNDTNFLLPEVGKILCCLCGASIIPNEAAMCTTCLKLQYQSEIPKSYEIELTQCPKCEKWHHRQSQWIAYDLESPELLSFCLKKIPFFANGNHSSMKILDSNWIWTEPHSRRLKVYVNYAHKLSNYQSLAITNQIQAEYIIKTRQCITCIYDNNDHKWNAMIQLRAFTASSSIRSQISSNTLGIAVLNAHITSKIFYQIESLLIQSKLYEIILDIETVNLSTHHSSAAATAGQQKAHANAVSSNGLNLYFHHKNQAEKVLGFLSEYFPFMTKTSKKLISSDQKNHSARTEHIILMELLPVNRHDVIIVPKQIHGKFDLMVVTKLSSVIHGVNPQTLRAYDVSVMKYCQYPFQTILNEKYLVPFIVLDVNVLEDGGGCGGSDGSSVASLGGSEANTSQKAKKKHHHRGKKTNKSKIWLAAEKNKPALSNTMTEEVILEDTNDEVEQGEEALEVATVQSTAAFTTKQSQKWRLAEVVVAKESDLGENDRTYTVRTHLGHLLQAGDSVLGYDLVHTVFGCQQQFSLNQMKGGEVPEVILVKKVFPEKEGKMKVKRKKNRVAPWRRNQATTGEGSESIVTNEKDVREGQKENEDIEEDDEMVDEDFQEMLEDLYERDLETIVEGEEEEDD